MEGLSCLLDEEPPLPSISEILLLHLSLQHHDKSYIATVKYRDALRWPFNVDQDHESLLAQLTDSPFRSANWTKRNPEPILPIKRIEPVDEDDDDEYSEDDSEIDDLTEKRPSPWTPLQHSPILYEALIQRLSGKNLDPILQRTIALSIMKKLETIFDRTREVEANLTTVKTPLDVPFVLNISKTLLAQDQVTRIQDRYESLLDLSKNV